MKATRSTLVSQPICILDPEGFYKETSVRLSQKDLGDIEELRKIFQQHMIIEYKTTIKYKSGELYLHNKHKEKLTIKEIIEIVLQLHEPLLNIEAWKGKQTRERVRESILWCLKNQKEIFADQKEPSLGSLLDDGIKLKKQK